MQASSFQDSFLVKKAVELWKKGTQFFQTPQTDQISNFARIILEEQAREEQKKVTELTCTIQDYSNHERGISSYNLFKQPCFQHLLQQEEDYKRQTIVSLAMQLFSFGKIEDDYEYVAQLISESQKSDYQYSYSKNDLIELSIRFIEYKENLSFKNKEESLTITLKILNSQNHTAYHGTNLSTLEEINANGLKRKRKTTEEIEKIRKITEQIFPLSFYGIGFLGPSYANSKDKVFVANEPLTACSYAQFAPEWFHVFSGSPSNPRDYSECQKKFINKISENLSKRKTNGWNQPIENELREICRFFEKSWRQLRTNSDGILCKIKHSFNPNSSDLQDLIELISNNDQGLIIDQTDKDESTLKNDILSKYSQEDFIKALSTNNSCRAMRNNEGIDDKDFASEEIEVFIIPL